jgi:hypothetical protein
MLPAQGKLNEDVKHLRNDPFVIKKVAEALKRIERVGFPKSLFLTRSNTNTKYKRIPTVPPPDLAGNQNALRNTW